MTKKVLFMLAMLTCIFASCSDGGSDDPVNPTPKPEEVKAEITLDSNIETNGLSFGVSAGDNTVSFTTNTNWTLTVSSTTSGTTWCTASATSGSKGSASVKFSVTENTEYDDRSVSVTVKAGTASKTFKITQKGVDALLVTTSSYEVPQEGGSIEVEVKANIDYQMEISETAKDWITEAKSKSRALKATNHKFDIALNEEAEKREGEIIFKSGDKVETVKVYQAGGALIMLTQNELTVSDAGETISVEIKSNVEFGVQMPEVDWITDEASSRGMSSHTLKYVVAPNEGYDSRTAEIIFFDKNSDLTDTLKVVQAQKDAIVISQKTYDVKAEGETIEVKLSANVDFEVTMPEVDWITQVESRGMKEHSLFYKISVNEGEDGRTAEIVYINTISSLEEKLIITQEGTKPKADVVINLTDAGTLSTYISEERIKTLTSIKIIGNLNGDDFDIIEDMSSLKLLDLSEANIVDGNSERMPTKKNVISAWSRSYIWNGIEKWEYWGGIPRSVEHFYLPQNLDEIKGVTNKTSSAAYSPFSSNILDYIGDGFDGQYNDYSNLNYIEIPSGLRIIGDGAFVATQLNKVVLPENLDSIKSFAFYACHELSEVIFSNSKLRLIEHDAFGRCYKLAKISLPEGLEEIGYDAFQLCRLERIDLPSTLKKIGRSAFMYYDKIPEVTKVYIANLNSWLNVELENLYSSPFYLYESLKKGNSDVNSLLYLNDELITSLEVDDVETVKNYVFAGCKSLEHVSIGNNVASIGKGAFRGCDKIKDLNIGDGVTVIEEGAFYGCNQLDKVTIGTGIGKVETNAFGNTKPSEVYSYAIVPPSIVSSKNFDKIDKETAKLYVPKGTYSAYYLSDWGSIFTNIIEME